MPPTAPPNSHPSEGRDQVGLATLLYGLIAAPAAWLAAEVFSAAVAQRACFPGYAPLAAPAFDGSKLIDLVAMLIALLVCASGIGAALWAWRRTRGEHRGGGGPLLDVGEGRSRFMALTGLMTSFGFLLAVLFSLPALMLTPVC